MDKKMFCKAMAVAACIAGALVTSGCAGTSSAEVSKAGVAEVGIVDAQLVVMAHPNMESARKAMDDEYAKVQNELMDTKALPPEQKQEKVNELRGRLAAKEKDTVAPVKDAASKAVNSVMEKHGMSIVIDKRTAVAGGTDITKEVLILEGLSEQDADAAIEKAKEQVEHRQ